MKFWKGNRIDGEFDMPVADVAAQFAAQYDPDAGWPLERALRGWLTDPEHFNSVWIAETGPDSFADLYDKVIGLVYP